MPLRNRVTPLGQLVAVPERGLVYGNRGCLHDASGEIRRTHATRRWIACRLRFRGWHRGPLLQPGRFTELFFLDEATAFAAGLRPCALCRRGDYERFGELWDDLHPGGHGADTIDARLHDERLAGRTRRLHEVPFRQLPDGAMALHDDAPHLVRAQTLRAWTPGGYGAAKPLPRGNARVITPPSLVSVLQAGWSGAVPLIHPTGF